MKKAYSLAIVVILFVIAGVWFTKEKNNKMSELNSAKRYENQIFGIGFDYPSDWKIEENKIDDGIQFLITAPDFVESSISKKLSVNVIQKKPGHPYSEALTACPKEREAGTLNINGKLYQRCDVGSGVHLYKLNFQEKNKLGNELIFEIKYNSAYPNSHDVKTIETIIQSIRF